MAHEDYEMVIGLEVHAQLNTASKLFCSDSTSFGGVANTKVSPVSLAHPGTLPVMNANVVKLALRLGLAMNCDIVKDNYFARKNYFYPDLPKGYQISQHTAPICLGGYLTINTSQGEKKVALNRIHIEEDAGKSLHDVEDHYTCIDLNRAGMPLLEIVTEPCMHSSEEAFAYLTELRKLVRWLDVCDGNMEEGSMRCDANISIRKKGEKSLGTKVEVKNLNSIRNVRKAIDLEVERLIKIAESGGDIVQETRSFDADSQTTFSLRVKEDADDYRYFPEPDLPPFHITSEAIDNIRNAMPETDRQVAERFIQSFGLSEYDARQMTADKEDVSFFESISNLCKHPKAVANWMMGPLRNFINEHGITFNQIPLSHATIAELISLAENGKTSFQVASTRLFQLSIENPNKSPLDLATQENLLQESDASAIEEWVNATLHDMADKVKEYKSGKKGLIGLFAGDVKRRSKGKADMQQVTQLLNKKLSE